MHVPPVPRAVFAPRIRPVPYLDPRDLFGLDALAEPFVFLARTWHDGNQVPAIAVDMQHVVKAAQLAVGHIQEVIPADYGAQCIPGVDVRVRIIRVAVSTAKQDRDAAIDAGGQDEEKLLEIRAMILGEPVGDALCRFPRRHRPLAARY